MDDDNEVRDRATFYLSVLEQKQKALNAGYILNGILSSLFIAFFKKRYVIHIDGPAHMIKQVNVENC